MYCTIGWSDITLLAIFSKTGIVLTIRNDFISLILKNRGKVFIFFKL